MNLPEINGLLAMINEYDQRITVTETAPQAWHRALEGDMELEWAAHQVIRFYANNSQRPISIAWLNTEWREHRRTNKVFPGLPEFTGPNKDASRWMMMYGILEGVEDLNLCRSRDGWVAPILRLREQWQERTGIPNPELNARKLFPKLDWEWFDSVRDEHIHRVR